MIDGNPEIHTFNTGAPYTAAGQRIAWCFTEEDTIAFADFDRMLDGFIKVSDRALFDIMTGSGRDNYVHRAYLNNRYTQGASWEEPFKSLHAAAQNA